MLQTFTFDVSGRQVNAAGNFFRYERETSGAADDSIRVRVDGNDCGVMRPGDSIELPVAFSMVDVTSVAGAVGEVRVGRGRLISSRTVMTGTLQTRAIGSAFANTAATVTNTSGVLLAAKASRTYLLVQNNHTSGSIWLVFGAAAAQAGGIKIPPGGYFEWNGSAPPTNAVYAIGDVASNALVTVVEG